MAGYEGHGYRRDRPYGARRPEDYQGPREDYGDRRAGYRGSYEDDWTGERYGHGPGGGFAREGRPYEEGVRSDPRRGRGWGRWEDRDDWDTGDLPPHERTDRDVRWDEPRGDRDWNRQGHARQGDWYETDTRTGRGISPRERERGNYRPRPGYSSPGGYGGFEPRVGPRGGYYGPNADTYGGSYVNEEGDVGRSAWVPGGGATGRGSVPGGPSGYGGGYGLPPYYGDRGGPSMSYGDFGGRASGERGDPGGASYGEWYRGDRRDRGERGGLRGRGPKSYQRTDERIREDVCERLMEHDGIDASELEVQVQDGEVTFEGEVPDRHTKFEVEELADAVLGVREVHNRLRVRRPGSRREPAEGSEGEPAAERGKKGARSDRKTPPILER